MKSKFKEKWAQFKGDMKEIAAVEELEAPNVGTSNKTASESAAERQEELEKEIIERSKKLHAVATEETAEETSEETPAETEKTPEATPEAISEEAAAETEKTPEATPAETAPETTPEEIPAETEKTPEATSAEAAPETTPETPEAPTKTEEPEAGPKTEPKEAKASEPEQPAEHEKAKEPEASAKAKSKDEVTSSVYPEMIVRSRDFYNSLGDMAFEKDVRRAKNEELDEYLIESVEVRPDLLDRLIDRHLLKFLADHPDKEDLIVFCNFGAYLERNLEDTPKIEQEIRRVHDKNIKVGIRYTRKKGKGEETYSTWKEAVASIQDAIDEYGIDPEEVFSTQYYWVDNPEVVISKAEAQKYVNSFRGDKKALKKILRLKN